MANTTGFRPEEMEKMAVRRQCLGTIPKYLTFIAVSKEESIEKDKELFPTNRMIYTDSSGFKGAIGAAAVAFTNGIKTAELQYQLSPITKHMVFKGELVAIILGLHLSRYILGTWERINLSIDNQVTIKTMDNNCPQLAQYLIDKIKDDIDRLHREEKAKRIRQNTMD